MLGLLTNSLYTIHKGESGGRGLSPRIWSGIAGQALSPDGASNLYMQADDFTNFGLAAAGIYVGNGLYTGYIDSGNTIAQLATEVGGVARLLTDTTDNDEVWLQPGTATSVFGKISDTAGDDKMLAFEARIRLLKVTDTYNVFVGLMEEGCAAADTITDAGALADKDYIGFSITESDGDALKFVYKKSGQTAQTVLTYGTALALNTWYKVGFLYDPKAPTSKRIKIFVDNVEQSTYVTGTNIAAATFPDGEELGFIAGVKNGSGAASHLDLDWYALAQNS